MKRFTKIFAAALLTSTFTASAFAGWGPNGQFGNAIPGSRPVGQSSTPSTNRASAPITTPFNPNGNLGAVPGSYKDPNVQAHTSKAEQAARIAKAKAAFDKKNNSPRLVPQNVSGNMSHSNGNGFFGNDVTNRPRPVNNYPQYPSNMGNSYPQYPSNMANNYPTNNYPQYPQQTSNYPSNNYPSKQSQFPMGGYGQGTSGYGGQSSSSGWGGYGGNIQTSGYSSQSTNGWGGYGGQTTSQYGMFAR